MKIRDLELQGITFLAPLAGITNLPFRMLVKSCGCSVVCSEMISAKGIFYNSKNTLKLLASRNEERPLSVQIFGSEPDSMAKAASFIEDMQIADIIDINLGCSVKKVVKQGAGVALMKEPGTAEKIFSAVRKAVDLPFTVKLRSGWDFSGRQAFETARIAVDCGVDAVVLHPRSAAQGFRGKSDWGLIKKLKEQLDVPVIGNGDIRSVEDTEKMLETTGCDAVMVGRAAMANPFLLSQIDQFIRTGTCRQIRHSDIFWAMEEIVNGYVEHFGPEPACRMLRGRLSWFVKGMPGCSALRQQLSGITSGQEAVELIKAFAASVSEQTQDG